MREDVKDLSPTERFDRTPRPLEFIRVRLYRNGQAEYVRQLLEDDQADLFDELSELRSKGEDENSPKITEVRANLMFVINALRDITRGMIELVGPDPDPR